MSAPKMRTALRTAKAAASAAAIGVGVSCVTSLAPRVAFAAAKPIRCARGLHPLHTTIQRHTLATRRVHSRHRGDRGGRSFHVCGATFFFSATASAATVFASKTKVNCFTIDGRGDSSLSTSCSFAVTGAKDTTIELELRDFRSLLPPGGASDGRIVVLVHGLDSWHGTWQATAEEFARRGIASVAVDLRGHGLSPMGSADDFGPQQLAADIRATLLKAGLLVAGASSDHRIVLVGHSMGGRIAMRYAADYPDDLAALVIEDMDCTTREYDEAYLELGPQEVLRRQRFDRAFQSWDACKEALLSFGYGSQRIDSWQREQPPRIFPRAAGGVWSAVNPHAQWLARRTVLSQADGYRSFQRLAGLRASVRPDLTVDVFVAGESGTVCSWDALPGGIRDMESVLPGLNVTVFANAGHSIHNSDRIAFADAVESVVRTVASSKGLK